MADFFHRRSIFLALLLFAASVFISTRVVLAVGRPAGVGPDHPGFAPQKHSDRPDQPDSSSSGEFRPASPSAFARLHLAGHQLQSCQSVERALTTRSQHLTQLVIQMEKTFTSIAQGVEQYYLNRVVPAGASLPDYDILVANITTAQNTLTPLVTAAQTDVTDFSCTGNNPVASMTQYRTDMQAVIKGLQVYRTSIKNLIVAVRTLPSITPTSTLIPSVTPPATPSATPAISPTATPFATPTPTTIITPSLTP